MPFYFSLPFTDSDSLIQKVEIHYKGPDKLNILTIYTVDLQSSAMVGHLLTGIHQKNFGWAPGKLALPEISGVIKVNDPEHTKLHPENNKSWREHHHVKFTNLTPEILLNFVNRISIIQQHPNIRSNLYNKLYKSPFAYVQSFFTFDYSIPKHLLHNPLLTEEQQYMLIGGYTEAYSKQIAKCPNISFLNKGSTQPQCAKIMESSDLRNAIGLAATQLNQEAFTNHTVQFLFLLFLACFGSKAISRCLKPKRLEPTQRNEVVDEQKNSPSCR